MEVQLRSFLKLELDGSDFNPLNPTNNTNYS